MCGKNLQALLSTAGNSGSPPRVREKQGQLPSDSTLDQDHPRVCGKNVVSTAGGNDGTGSPPRVREKQKSPIMYIYPLRITPACAGKTYSETTELLTAWDHPRVCGKNSGTSL